MCLCLIEEAVVCLIVEKLTRVLFWKPRSKYGINEFVASAHVLFCVKLFSHIGTLTTKMYEGMRQSITHNL